MWRKPSHSIPGAQKAQMPPLSSSLKLEQPESPQSHQTLHAPLPGSPAPPCKNTGRSAPQTLHVAECLCCGVTSSGGRRLNNLPPSESISSRRGFNKAERKLKSKIIGYRAKLTFIKHLGAEQQTKNLVLILLLVTVSQHF